MQPAKFFAAAVLGVLLGFGSAHAFDLGPIDIHGFISQGYIKSTSNNYLVKSEKGSFEFNEIGLTFSTSLSERLWLGMELLARDLGDVGNNEVQIAWGFADYRWRNELGLRFGKIKTPCGFYNEGRDTDLLRTWVLLPESIYRESFRDMIEATEGAGVYGTLDAGTLGSFEYQEVLGALGKIGLEQKNFGNQIEKLLQPFALLGQTITADDIDSSSRWINTAQVIWNTPLQGLRLGSSYTIGKVDLEVPAQSQIVNTNPLDPTALEQVNFPERLVLLEIAGSVVVSGEYKWNDLTLAAEFSQMQVKLDYNEPTLGPTMTGLGLSLPGRITTQGYYASLAYRFTDWLELGAYYNVYYPDKDDRDGDDLVADAALVGRVAPDHQAWQKDTCLTARFDITPSWTLKLEGHHMDGTALVLDYTDANDLSETWSLYAAKVSFSF